MQLCVLAPLTAAVRCCPCCVLFNPKLRAQELFGLPNVDTLLRTQQPLPLVLHDNPGSKLLHELLTALRQNRSAYMRLRVAKKGDPFYPLFTTMMVEDRSSAGMSYVEFLCHVHRQIQEKMS
jgi:protein transport protein SEC24